MQLHDIGLHLKRGEGRLGFAVYVGRRYGPHAVHRQENPR